MTNEGSLSAAWAKGKAVFELSLVRNREGKRFNGKIKSDSRTMKKKTNPTNKPTNKTKPSKQNKIKEIQLSRPAFFSLTLNYIKSILPISKAISLPTAEPLPFPLAVAFQRQGSQPTRRRGWEEQAGRWRATWAQPFSPIWLLWTPVSNHFMYC